MSKICWAFFSCFLHHVSTHCMCIFIILIPLSLSLTLPPLKALRYNYEAKFIDCPMAHFMMCVLRRLFQVSQSHTRKGGKWFIPFLQMPSCVVFLALAFIFLNQYNRVHEVLCVLYARHLSLAPRRRLCVQSKMIKLSIFIYFFPSFFFFGSKPFGWWNCFTLCSVIRRGVWVNEKKEGMGGGKDL